MKNDPRVLAKLLRAIATGEQAQMAKQDVIFNAAAAELERLTDVVSQMASASQSEATSRLRHLARDALS